MCVALCVSIVCALYCQCVMYCFACRDNLVFVMSDCPHSSEDLAAFFHLRARLPSTQLKGRGSDTKGVFLSEGLSAQLKKCSLSLHWVDTSPLQGKTQVVVVAVLSQQKGIDVQWISGCLSHHGQTKIQTDQLNASYTKVSPSAANLIGQFVFLFSTMGQP